MSSTGGDVRLRRSWRILSGERFAPEDLPGAVYYSPTEYARPNDYDLTDFPAWVSGQENTFVNSGIADVMRGFTLGDHALHPVDVFMDDGVTRMDVEYFLLPFRGAETDDRPG